MNVEAMQIISYGIHFVALPLVLALRFAEKIKEYFESFIPPEFQGWGNE